MIIQCLVHASLTASTVAAYYMLRLKKNQGIAFSVGKLIFSQAGQPA